MNLGSAITPSLPKNTPGGPGPALGFDIPELWFRKGLLALALVGLVIRLGFFVEHARSPSFGVPTLDQTYYDTVARMLLAGDDLHALHGFRPLLYPLFLAFWYKLGGSAGIDLALSAQHGLGVATGLIVAVLGARVFKNRLCGLAGGALYLLAPVPLYFEGELLIEPSYIFLIFAGLLLIVFAAETEGRKGMLLWAAAGAVTVLTSQARANIIVFLAVYPLFAFWRWRQRRDPRAAFSPLLGLAGALAMAIPWGWVNMKQMDHFHLLPNAGGVAFYCGNKRTADGMMPQQDRRITSGERYEDSIEVWARQEYERAMREQGRQPDTDPMAISKYWTSQTLREIRTAPAAWLGLVAKKCWLTLWNAEIPNNKAFAFLQQEFVWLRLLPVRWVVLLMLAPIGIWAAAKWGNRDELFVVLVYAGLYSAANVAFFICDRYRYPVWPALAVLAGGGLIKIVQLVQRRALGDLAWVGATMTLMAVLSLHNWFGAQLPSFARDYLFRSLAYYQKGQFQPALADIDQSVKLDPLDGNALEHRANVLFALDRLDDARQAYEQTLQIIPEEASAWNNLGTTLDHLGRTDEALNAFRRAIGCAPPSKNAFLGMAFIQIRTGRLTDAAATLDQADKLGNTASPAILATRSVLERRRGNIAHADELELQARQLDPDTTAWATNAASQRPTQ
ncbi:MAG TPA: tetratricopeptide repeat protein [Verrucomicrobiae bacterium]|nr:tetratricopeptide repeat protein [Verrucomicrobiae bacterium]